MARPSRLLAGSMFALLAVAVAASDVHAWGYNTPTPTPKKTPTPTPKPTKTPSPTATPTPKPTKTPSPTATPTPKPTKTPSPTATPTPTKTPSPTATPTPTKTPSPTNTPKPTATPTPKPTNTPRPTGTAVVPPTPVATGTPVAVCNHNCPDKIRFSKFDQLMVRSAFPIGAWIPDDADLEIRLENAAGVIYEASLQPGDLSRRGKSLVFMDRNAKKGTGFRGGIAKVKIQQVPNGKGVRVQLECYGDLSEAVDPTMTLTLRVGEHSNEITDTWQQTNFGWFRFHN